MLKKLISGFTPKHLEAFLMYGMYLYTDSILLQD